MGAYIDLLKAAQSGDVPAVPGWSMSVQSPKYPAGALVSTRINLP